MFYGKFIFISYTENTYNNQLYLSANVELEDSDVISIPCDDFVRKLKKYSSYNGIFDYTVYRNGKSRFALIGVEQQ